MFVQVIDIPDGDLLDEKGFILENLNGFLDRFVKAASCPKKK